MLWAQKCRLLHCSDRAGDGQDWTLTNRAAGTRRKAPGMGDFLLQVCEGEASPAHGTGPLPLKCFLAMAPLTILASVSRWLHYLQRMHFRTPGNAWNLTCNCVCSYVNTYKFNSSSSPSQLCLGTLLSNYLNTSPMIGWWWMVITNRATK